MNKNNNYIAMYKKFMKLDNKKTLSKKNWPLEWKKIFFKGYPRFSKISLDKAVWDIENNYLTKTIYKRRSVDLFTSKKHIDRDDISYLLLSAAITITGKNIYSDSYRSYPSAGRRYPLEVYLLIMRSNDLKKGVYHYNVRTHSLEFLWEISKKEIQECFKQEFVAKSGVIFLISSVIDRSYIKYGDITYQFMNLEAGHIMQNLSLLAESKKYQYRYIGRFDYRKVMKLLDIQIEDRELILYALAIA